VAVSTSEGGVGCDCFGAAGRLTFACAPFGWTTIGWTAGIASDCGLFARLFFCSEFIGISCTRIVSGAERGGALGAATAVDDAGEELAAVAESEDVETPSEAAASGELLPVSVVETDGAAGELAAGAATGSFTILCTVGDPGRYCSGWMFCHAK